MKKKARNRYVTVKTLQFQAPSLNNSLFEQCICRRVEIVDVLVDCR